ncbi:MAG: hypothetical protein ACSNEK_03395 [Parachlamydiaceae bacterium]
MNPSFEYDAFKTSIQLLSKWDPNTEYITKNLTRKKKSRRVGGCFACLFNLFRRSRAGEATTAAFRLEQYTKTFRKELKADSSTLRKLRKLNHRIRENLAQDVGVHRLRKSSQRNYLDLVCRSIDNQIEDILQTDEASSLRGRVSELNLSSHDSTSTDDDSTSTDDYVPFSTLEEPPKEKRATRELNEEYYLPQFRTPKDLCRFVDNVFTNPHTTLEEAVDCLKALNTLLEERGTIKTLLQKQAGHDTKWLHDEKLKPGTTTTESDQILRAVILFKQRFPKAERTEEFKRECTTFCTTVRRRFYDDRISMDRKELSALAKTIYHKLSNARSPQQREDATTVLEIVKEWALRSEKAKPIGIPKWFHCTKRTFVNALVKTGSVEVRHQGAFPGAYASSVPEMGDEYNSYGPYCFALSKHIEDQASSSSQLPLITNVNGGSSTPHQTPIVLTKDAKPVLKTDRYSQKQPPKVWAGFQKDIILRKIEKSTSPLAYYGKTTLCFFAFIAQNNHLDLDDQNWNELKKVRILSRDQFSLFVNIIHQTFHFTVPDTWRDAKVPTGCFGVSNRYGGYAERLGSAAGVIDQKDL